MKNPKKAIKKLKKFDKEYNEILNDMKENEIINEEGYKKFKKAKPSIIEFKTENKDYHYLNIEDILVNKSKTINRLKEIDSNSRITSIFCILVFTDMVIKTDDEKLLDFIEKDPIKATEFIYDEKETHFKESVVSRKFCLFGILNRVENSDNFKMDSYILEEIQDHHLDSDDHVHVDISTTNAGCEIVYEIENLFTLNDESE